MSIWDPLQILRLDPLALSFARIVSDGLMRQLARDLKQRLRESACEDRVSPEEITRFFSGVADNARRDVLAVFLRYGPQSPSEYARRRYEDASHSAKTRRSNTWKAKRLLADLEREGYLKRRGDSGRFFLTREGRRFVKEQHDEEKRGP